jgi:hypothetical protein
MRPTIQLTLAAALFAGAAMILRGISRRQRRPSAISQTLEHEDYVPDYIASGEDATLDDRVAPGAPL